MAANEGATISSLSSLSEEIEQQSSSRKRKREITTGDLPHHQPEIEETKNNNSSNSPFIKALVTTTEAATTTDKPTNEGETSSTVVDPNSTNKPTGNASTAMGEKSVPPAEDQSNRKFEACREKHNKKLAGQRMLCSTRGKHEKKEVEHHIAVEQVIINNSFDQVEDRLEEKWAFIKFNTEEAMSNALKLDIGLRVPGYANVPTYKIRRRSRNGRGDGYIFKDYKHRREPTHTRFDSDEDEAMIEA